MSKNIMALSMSYEACAEFYSYNPKTGQFTTVKQVSYLHPTGKIRPVIMKKPKPESRPHACLVINGYPRRAAHIAHLLMTGESVPDGMGLFFKDGDPANLKWDNLVLADLRTGGRLPG